MERQDSHTSQFITVEVLPDEIILQIFVLLSQVELVRAASVCKRWRLLGQDPALWETVDLSCRKIPLLQLIYLIRFRPSIRRLNLGRVRILGRRVYHSKDEPRKISLLEPLRFYAADLVQELKSKHRDEPRILHWIADSLPQLEELSISHLWDGDDSSTRSGLLRPITAPMNFPVLRVLNMSMLKNPQQHMLNVMIAEAPNLEVLLAGRSTRAYRAIDLAALLRCQKLRHLDLSVWSYLQRFFSDHLHEMKNLQFLAAEVGDAVNTAPPTLRILPCSAYHRDVDGRYWLKHRDVIENAATWHGFAGNLLAHCKTADEVDQIVAEFGVPVAGSCDSKWVDPFRFMFPRCEFASAAHFTYQLHKINTPIEAAVEFALKPVVLRLQHWDSSVQVRPHRLARIIFPPNDFHYYNHFQPLFVEWAVRQLRIELVPMQFLDMPTFHLKDMATLLPIPPRAAAEIMASGNAAEWTQHRRINEALFAIVSRLISEVHFARDWRFTSDLMVSAARSLFNAWLPDFSYRNAEGYTLPQAACAMVLKLCPDPEANRVQLGLLMFAMGACGADLNLPPSPLQANNPEEGTVLHYLVRLLHHKQLETRLHLFKLDVPNNRGQHALYTALECGRFEAALLLLERGAPFVGYNALASQTTLLHDAAKFDSCGVIRVMMSREDAPLDVNALDAVGWTPLMVAVANNHFQVVEDLLQCGADPNIQDPASGRTALMMCTQVTMSSKCLKRLLQCKRTAVNAVDHQGRSALFSEWQGKKARKMIHSLLKAGCRTNVKDNDGLTASDLVSHQALKQLLSGETAVTPSPARRARKLEPGDEVESPSKRQATKSKTVRSNRSHVKRKAVESDSTDACSSGSETEPTARTRKKLAAKKK
eukprot:TRINITY_DN828_c0_g1_i1.p1 TRINITY_DN828_c0_g1~~TRINITY_DN828_c0_g1_i1.p1  ORF type:complete len:948 (+),score=123.79 TRINITY_DN828_c0_g1_i1:218-2845(+)